MGKEVINYSKISDPSSWKSRVAIHEDGKGGRSRFGRKIKSLVSDLLSL